MPAAQHDFRRVTQRPGFSADRANSAGSPLFWVFGMVAAAGLMLFVFDVRTNAAALVD